MYINITTLTVYTLHYLLFLLKYIILSNILIFCIVFVYSKSVRYCRNPTYTFIEKNKHFFPNCYYILIFL